DNQFELNANGTPFLYQPGGTLARSMMFYKTFFGIFYPAAYTSDYAELPYDAGTKINNLQPLLKNPTAPDIGEDGLTKLVPLPEIQLFILGV
ncbi:MAG TPA: hypothetical protein DCM40_17870, partial [Maribacter sp.]|nr:hypothetical protein [Maribacter sp.]